MNQSDDGRSRPPAPGAGRPAGGPARRAGWAFFGLASPPSSPVWSLGLTGLVVVVVIASLVLGSALLLPAIIVGFGVTAAEREDPGR